MRASALVLISVLALAACSQKAPPVPPAAPTPRAAPAPPATPAPTPLAAEETPAPPPAPPQEEAIRFSPADYGAHERRVTALINNAESRDTLGETPRLAAEGRAQRARCASRACVERSYAAEEARLRKWEGSSDIK